MSQKIFRTISYPFIILGGLLLTLMAAALSFSGGRTELIVDNELAKDNDDDDGLFAGFIPVAQADVPACGSGSCLGSTDSCSGACDGGSGCGGCGCDGGGCGGCGSG
jgi:hypothetical protein